MEKFAIHHRLIGKPKQMKIAQTHAAVIGVGGLGCTVAEGLIRLGVQEISLVDFDHIEASNLPRQSLFFESDIQRPKVEVAQERLAQIFQGTQIHTFQQHFSSTLGKEMLQNVDVVIDCTDNYIARYAISKCCYDLNMPMVYGGVSQFEGQVGVFNYQGSAPFHHLFPDIKNLLSQHDCDASGVLPFVVQLVANYQLAEAYKIICEEDEHLLNNQLLCLNALTGKQRVLKLSPNIKTI